MSCQICHSWFCRCELVPHDPGAVLRINRLEETLKKAEAWINESFDFEMRLAKHKSGCELRDEIRALLAAAPDMTTVSDAVFGTRHNCRCENECQAASYIARGETFRCRLTAK